MQRARLLLINIGALWALLRFLVDVLPVRCTLVVFDAGRPSTKEKIVQSRQGPIGRLRDAVRLEHHDSPKATVTPAAASRPNRLGGVRPNTAGVAHVILAVADDGSPTLTTYRRVILKVRAEPLAKR